ncbi:MAG TPA: patatin-like phospholipase family protein [Actinomycetota bacterium]|jgi:NTE family protein|nr:patatin-like phospholipase family protein [Actinomycetota bacterium]
MAIRNLFHQRPRTAFVLGGGGNLGAVQVGQLRALLEHEIVPDVVIGCSVGALNGAAIAGDPTLAEVERLADLWRGLGPQDVFPSNRLGRGPWMFVRTGLSAYSDHGLRRVIDGWLQYRLFEETKVPFCVVATSLATGREHWFQSGDVRRPLMASTALPGVFPPVAIDGHVYMDGGVVNNVPVSKAFDLKAKKVFVLDVGSLERDRKEPKRPYEVLLQAVSIARASRFRIDQENVPDGVQLVRMPGVDAGRLRYDNFTRSAELIERSYKASTAFLNNTHEAIA